MEKKPEVTDTDENSVLEEEEEEEQEKEEEQKIEELKTQVDETAKLADTDKMADNFMIARNLRIQPFSGNPAAEDTAEKWTDWLQALEREMRFLRIKEAEDKKDCMLIYGGHEIVRLEKSLPEVPEQDPVLDEYGKLKAKLNKYFLANQNKHNARYLFNHMKPVSGENIVTYVTRLREKAQGCEFHDTDDRILEKVIGTIEDEKLIYKAITKKLNLTQFLEEASRTEEIAKQIAAMRENTKTVNKIGREKGHRPDRRGKELEKAKIKCSYCGLTGKHPPGRDCPAYGKKCHKCGNMNHFQSACKAKDSKEKMKDKGSFGKKIKATKKDDPETSSDDEYFAKLVILKVSDKKEEKTLNVKMNEILIKIEPDSGAEVNLMDEHQFKSLKKRATEEIELRPSKMKLRTIQGRLTTKGEFTATISNKQHTVEATIVVITGHMESAPLLGKDTLIQLGMLKLDGQGSLKEKQVMKIQGENFDDLITKYKVFEGMGLIHDKSIIERYMRS